MPEKFTGYAAFEKGAPLMRHDFDPAPLEPDMLEVEVLSCGICHSDLSMIDNDWGSSFYPLVPGHEVVGKVTKLGSAVKHLQPGQLVGIGWFSGSCQHCYQCSSGRQNLCATPEQTIVGRPGGFANRLRAQAAWAIPLPAGLDSRRAGPLFCGGITVFAPIVLAGVKPTDRVGVIGIGGLGHLALKFLNKWGCEVHAFSTTPSKRDEILRLGAHHVVNPKDPGEIQKLRGQLNFILSTINVPTDWNTVLDALAPMGRLHLVGAVLEPIPVPAMSLILGQKSIAGSPLGSPSTVRDMLDFCARHQIAPQTEHFPMSRVNEALEHLRQGKARYRLVLENDF